MIKKNNRTCLVCGKKYTYCPSCAEYESLPTWMAMWCSKNCKDIFYVAADLLNGHITEEEAKERFDKCDLTGKEHFSEKVQLAMKMAYEAKQPESIKEDNDETDVRSVSVDPVVATDISVDPVISAGVSANYTVSADIAADYIVSELSAVSSGFSDDIKNGRNKAAKTKDNRNKKYSYNKKNKNLNRDLYGV